MPEDKPKLKVLDLFSGILVGGFSLGLERTGGFSTVAFCEIEPKANAVLAYHWPDVPRFADIKELHGEIGAADVICGGFPCQPYSTASAGKRKGAQDDRALWPEMRRLVRQIRPAWVIGENVAGIDSLDLERVVSDLEALDYQVQPFVVPACAVGSDHRRDRFWIIGHTDKDGKSKRGIHAKASRLLYRGPHPARLGKTHGVSAWMGLLGNAVHPAVVEQIGHAILQAEATS
jgi:DNA (cytosine-5)-methyltransferase 1